MRLSSAVRGHTSVSALPHRTLRWQLPALARAGAGARHHLNDDEKLVACAKEIHRELRPHEVRAEADFSPDPIKAKIAEAEKAKVHTMLVIGGPEARR